MPEEQKNALVSVKDLAGLSTPITKLIETVGAAIGRASDGVSRIANAYLLASKDAKNEAKRIGLVEGAKTEVIINRAKRIAELSANSQQHLKKLTINPDGDVSAQLSGLPAQVAALQERSLNRLEYQNVVRQINLEAVLENAAAELTEETDVSQEPVNNDWTVRFFNIIEEISSEEMQAIWGKVLAGEVKRPGSYSLRTLDILRNLTQQEASFFREVANLVIVAKAKASGQNSAFIYKSSYVGKNVDYHKFLRLFDCGLIQPVVGKFKWDLGEKKVIIKVGIGNKTLRISGIANPTGIVSFQKYTLTSAGLELMHLIDANSPLEYIKEFGQIFAKMKLKTEYAEIIGKDTKGIIQYSGPFVDL